MMNPRKLGSSNHPLVFLLVSTDHAMPKTGASPTVTVSKDGGPFAPAAGSVTEIGNGLYALAGNVGDRDTVGVVVFRAVAPGADDAVILSAVVEYDPFVSSSADVAEVLARIGSPAVSLAADVAAVKGDTAGIGSIGSNVVAIRVKSDLLAFDTDARVKVTS